MDFGFNSGNFLPSFQAESEGPTVAIDTTAAIVHTYTTSQNHTINFSNDGHFCTLVITCDATPRTVTYGTGVHGAASTIVLTASKKNVLHFIYDGTEHVLVSSNVLA